jgi:cytochrome c biogenesis protein CcdA
MDLATPGLAFAAGLLSIPSPCVLPLLPVVFATAASEHRLGPAALAAGLALSFLAVGLLVATVGFSIGLDLNVFRKTTAVLLVGAGAVLFIPALQTKVALLATPIGAWTETRFRGRTPDGLAGQFCVGALLGAVWSPCVGPTLGAASVLAAQGRDLLQVALTMLLFALGTALPMLVIGALSRKVLMRWRGRMLSAGKTGKVVLGTVLAATGALILAGYDKTIEAALVSYLPDWLSGVTGAL